MSTSTYLCFEVQLNVDLESAVPRILAVVAVRNTGFLDSTMPPANITRAAVLGFWLLLLLLLRLAALYRVLLRLVELLRVLAFGFCVGLGFIELVVALVWLRLPLRTANDEAVSILWRPEAWIGGLTSQPLCLIGAS